MNFPTPVTDSSDGERYRNPLWIVVGAMACLFALLACLVAAG